MEKQKTYRVQHKFWLNIMDTSEEALDAEIWQLKKARLFSKTIRDGIRLVCDLRAGRFDVLFELFPEARQKLSDILHPPETPTQKAIKEQLARIETVINQQPVMLAAGATENTPKYLNIPKIEDTNVSIFSEEKVDPAEARQNFSAGFGDLFADEEDDLWDD